MHDDDNDDNDEGQTVEEARVAQIETAMRDAGQLDEVKVQEDYFAFDETHREMLPDGVSWIDHRAMNEGQRRKYLNATNRDVRLKKVSGDAIIRMSPGDERKALLEAAICGWNLMKGGKPFLFCAPNLAVWLDKAPPRIIDIIEKAVRLANPWLLAEASVEELLKERDTLDEMIEAKRVEEAGKAT